MEPVRAAIAMTIGGGELPFDGALRAAEMLVRITASLLMVPTDSLPIDTDEHARWFAETYFPAIIKASAGPGPD